MDIQSQILQIIEMVMNSTLALPVVQADASQSASSQSTSASIQISGDWQGTVYLDFEPRLGALIAGVMLDIDPQTAGPADIRDAMGELTNMIGGNIKALMPGENNLSQPRVNDVGVTIPPPIGSELLSTIPLSSYGHRFCVRVVRQGRKLAA